MSFSFFLFHWFSSIFSPSSSSHTLAVIFLYFLPLFRRAYVVYHRHSIITIATLTNTVLALSKPVSVLLSSSFHFPPYPCVATSYQTLQHLSLSPDVLRGLPTFRNTQSLVDSSRYPRVDFLSRWNTGNDTHLLSLLCCSIAEFVTPQECFNTSLIQCVCFLIPNTTQSNISNGKCPLYSSASSFHQHSQHTNTWLSMCCVCLVITRNTAPLISEGIDSETHSYSTRNQPRQTLHYFGGISVRRRVLGFSRD